MYMLRTEIRKLGGLICFLFVMLAIQAQQYTVTGGNGDATDNLYPAIVYEFIWCMEWIMWRLAIHLRLLIINGIDISKRHWTGNLFRVNRMGRHPLSGI